MWDERYRSNVGGGMVGGDLHMRKRGKRKEKRNM